MGYCKKCGKPIDWMKGNKPGVWIPLDREGEDIDHRDVCVPNPKYIKKVQLIMGKAKKQKEEPLQIGENEFV